MFKIGDKTIARLWVNSQAVQVLYVGATKIWEAVRSCFGSGVWRENKAWSEKEKWKE